MFDDPRLLISLGTTLCTLAAAFGVIRWEVRNLNKIISDIEGRIRALDRATDKQEVELSKHAQSLTTYGEMLSPKERENRAMMTATMQRDIEYLKQTTAHLSKLHNGQHVPVSNTRNAE
jgi:hypothetical protein